jgi:hypothetical protein
MNKNKKELISKIGVKEYQKLSNLIDDLGWDFDRFSSSGQETYKELCKKLGWEFES